MTTTRKKQPPLSPSVCIESEARAIVRNTFQGPVAAPPTAMLEAYTELLGAAYDAQRAEMFRLRKEGLTYAAIGEVVGATRQSVQEYLMRHGAGVVKKLPLPKGGAGRTSESGRTR